MRLIQELIEHTVVIELSAHWHLFATPWRTIPELRLCHTISAQAVRFNYLTCLKWSASSRQQTSSNHNTSMHPTATRVMTAEARLSHATSQRNPSAISEANKNEDLAKSELEHYRAYSRQVTSRSQMLRLPPSGSRRLPNGNLCQPFCVKGKGWKGLLRHALW